jgi:hypothetical protein
MAKQGIPAPTTGTRVSPRIKEKRLARTSNTDKPESKSERKKRKAAEAAAKAIAGDKSATPKATEVQETTADTNTEEEDDPVEITTKPPKRRVVPPPTKKRRTQKEPKKAVVVSIPEEIDDDDDSSFSDEEVDAGKKDELDDDDKENSSSSGDDNDMVPSDSSDEDNSSTKRMRRFQKDIEKTSAQVENRHREELNQHTQRGAEDPPHDTSLKANMPSSTRGIDRASTVVPRGMSNAVSIVKREKHVATRIMQFVKSEVFRRIKFVNSAEMFQKAFVKVIEFEKVPPHNHLLFQLTYESCFNKALNTKRSSCEQAGGMLARKAIADLKKRGEDFFTIEEFCKLRRATTERERRAFFWFFDSFLECVCGARAWRNAKKTMMASVARDEHNGIIVTKSDEAFALLLIDNYLEKWKKMLEAEEQSADAEPVDNMNMTGEEAQADRRQRKKVTTKLPGKYTEKKSGHCKYGGWSRAGMARFNELYSLVNDDRASAQSEQMERELLAFCRSQAGMSDELRDAQQEGGIGGNNALETAEAMPVEATWDSDND